MKVILRDTSASYFSKTDGITYTGKNVFSLPEAEALEAISNRQIEKVEDEPLQAPKKAEKVAKANTTNTVEPEKES